MGKPNGEGVFFLLYKSRDTWRVFFRAASTRQTIDSVLEKLTNSYRGQLEFAGADQSEMDDCGIAAERYLKVSLDIARLPPFPDGESGRIRQLRHEAEILLTMLASQPTKVEVHAPEQSAPPDLGAEARALAILASRPDLATITAIAKEAGCSREYLGQQCPKFKAAWKISQVSRKAGRRTVRGSKDKDGNMEAWEDVPDPPE